MKTAEPDRSQVWRHDLGATFGELAPERLGAGEPAGAMSGARLGQVLTFEIAGTPQILRRTTGAVGRVPTDLLKVCVQLRGRATIHQDGRELVLEQGQLGIYDTGRAYDLRLENSWACAVMAFPREALGMPWTVLVRAMQRAYPADRGLGSMFTDLVRGAVTQAGSFQPGGAQRLGDAGLSLLAGTLSDHAGPSIEEASEALREQVLGHIRQHLSDPHLSRGTVAARFGMSPRSLNRLFALEPRTVTDQIRHLRLEAAHRDLLDPLLAHRSIGAIAARQCFVDAAHFSRVFRAEYGITPSGLRDRR